MLLTTLLVATMSAVPSAAPAQSISADPSVSITTAFVEAQNSSKSELAAELATTATFGLTRSLMDLANPVPGDSSPFMPLDGAGISQDTKSILALLLGLLVGFGTGHLVAGDKSGFILFLIIDIVIWAVRATFWGIGVFWALDSLPYLALLISHVIQGLDAYGKASGDPIIRSVREKQIRVSSAPGREEHPLTTRAFGFSF